MKSTTLKHDFDDEFLPVNTLLSLTAETRAVDAFALSLIKVEKQIRRIFTFLIYQHPNYIEGDGIKLREVLSSNKKMYLDNFVKGINQLLSKTVEQIYGPQYAEHYDEIKKITSDRNKIFHGQVTGKSLTREQLINKVEFMKGWCKNLADKFDEEIGYDGFGRNAYRKSDRTIDLRNLADFESPVKYADFLKSINR